MEDLVKISLKILLGESNVEITKAYDIILHFFINVEFSQKSYANPTLFIIGSKLVLC